ncbi:MAG: TetR/AcrR family transcriptional regulator [Spongiibacter sp.]|uniref:TetR/AcrR family transcriptional regulator n=1 Tax=Spongiibacter thalassae TaxID=2721624 RepID=A0ABX1GK07_9GAMM|nr:TetR/AcrR family transcriptional regulator [Spongiibacter thalassae]MDX1504403.1 TetR/AcrR family transcriptional regulator [Spongiibacter sp.]NKI19301.1 TetR/AcrR family transcriptional regulator [Spongiibacter thalassae]
MSKARKTGTRTRLSREQRQEEIIRAARKVFEKQGYESSTIADIAEEVGVVEGTVLHYFKTKRALMAKVIEEFYSDITATMELGVSRIHGTRNRIRYVIHTHMSFLHDNADLCTVILNESRGSQTELLDKVHKLNKRYTNVVVTIVREGKENGEIAEFASPILVRNVVFGAIEHYLWDLVSGTRREDIDDISDQLTQLVYSGIVSRPDNISSEVNQLILKLNTLIN